MAKGFGICLSNLGGRAPDLGGHRGASLDGVGCLVDAVDTSTGWIEDESEALGYMSLLARGLSFFFSNRWIARDAAHIYTQALKQILQGNLAKAAN